MYRIRYSKVEDIPAVASLMQNTFGDTDDFMRRFFHYFYQDNVLVAEDRGDIVSMAFLLPAFIDIKQQKLPATYLYACATREDYRGKGLMGGIIEEAYRDVCRHDEVGLFLLPAGESLYGYYKKYGFRDFFYEHQETYTPQDLPVTDRSNTCRIERISGKEYHRQRSVILTDEFAVHYPLSHFEFADREYGENVGGLYRVLSDGDPAGIAFIQKGEEGILKVKELLTGTDDQLPLFQYLIRKFKVRKLIVSRPGYAIRTAMLRCHPDYEFLHREKGYFNFALD